MTKRRQRWVTIWTGATTLVALCCLIGCPTPQTRNVVVTYQEIGIIQLESRFVPLEIVLVKGRPARLHLTNAIDRTTAFAVPSLNVHGELRHGELTQVTMSVEQLAGLDGERFTCPDTGNGGTFRVVEGAEPIQRANASGTVELAIVMTDDLAAPKTVIVKRGMPVKLYATKTRGEEEDDTILIDAWGIRKDIEFGEVTEIEFTPEKTGEVTFMGIITPSSRGTIRVID